MGTGRRYSTVGEKEEMKNIQMHKAIAETLVPTHEYVLVNFSVWGVACAAVFPETAEALRWCRICIENGFCYPTGIYDADGEVLYSEDDINE